MASGDPSQGHTSEPEMLGLECSEFKVPLLFHLKIYILCFPPLKLAFTTSWYFLGELDIVVLAFIDGQMNSCHLTV